MKVYVKPIDSIEKWHGKKGKDNFTRPKVVEALVSRETGRYDTGLTEEEAKEYGEKMGVDLSDTFVLGQAHPYYSTKAGMAVLPNHTIILDTAKPADYVKIKLMKASSDVANSQKELEDGKWPEATHVIFDEEEEISVKASKVAMRNKCISVAMKMTYDEKADIVRILSNKSVKNRSNEFIDVEIDSIINDHPEDFERHAKMDKAERTTRGIIHEALYRHILIKDGPTITFMGDVLGGDIEDTVKFFTSPDNQAIKVAILEKINAK